MPRGKKFTAEQINGKLREAEVRLAQGKTAVVAALTHLLDLLQGDVGVAAQVLKALVGDVILETRQVEGQPKPQMVARFTIDAVPALAVLKRNKPKDRDDAPGSVWGSIHPSPGAEPATVSGPTEAVVPLI